MLFNWLHWLFSSKYLVTSLFNVTSIKALLQPAVRESHPCVWWTKFRFSMAAGNRRQSWSRQDAFICEYVVLTVHVRVVCRLRFLGGHNCPVSRAWPACKVLSRWVTCTCTVQYMQVSRTCLRHARNTHMLRTSHALCLRLCRAPQQNVAGKNVSYLKIGRGSSRTVSSSQSAAASEPSFSWLESGIYISKVDEKLILIW